MKLIKSAFIFFFIVCLFLREAGFRPVHTLIFISTAKLCGFLPSCYSKDPAPQLIVEQNISGAYRFYAPTGEEAPVTVAPDKINSDLFSSDKKPNV